MHNSNRITRSNSSIMKIFLIAKELFKSSVWLRKFIVIFILLTAHVTAQSCTITGTSSGVDASTCGACNGSATATPTSGAPPYTYIWDDPSFQTNATANALCAGVYQCTITDVGACTVVVFVEVNEVYFCFTNMGFIKNEVTLS